MAVALQLITAADFQQFTGEDFVFHFSNIETGTARLETVITLPGALNVERKPFSILFQTAQKNHVYQQGIYTIEHPVLGTMELFLVPVACNEKGLQYEAVFS